MSKCLALTALAVILGISSASGQTSPPPAQYPPTTPAPAPKPAPPNVWRYGALSGAWLMPSGDFEKFASDGWAITLDGYQFVDLNKRIAVGTEVGYYDFGEKNTVDVSNFPVDAVLRIFPKGDQTKIRPFIQGGLGFNYTRTEVNRSSASDYYFGTQAGGGLTLHGGGPVAFRVDAVYHWVFADEPDYDFWSLRGGILIPMAR